MKKYKIVYKEINKKVEETSTIEAEDEYDAEESFLIDNSDIDVEIIDVLEVRG